MVLEWSALLAGGPPQSWLDSMMSEVLCGRDVSIYLKPVICIVLLFWRNGSGSSVKRSVDGVEPITAHPSSDARGPTPLVL